jgi:hypothetical protein
VPPHGSDDLEAMSNDAALPTTIDIALNEATWLDAVVDRNRRQVAPAFDVLTLPQGSGGSGHLRVSLVLKGVHRFVASHRLGRWDDDDAAVLPYAPSDLSAVVRAFGGVPVYGWEFFDTSDEQWRRWSKRLSPDERWGSGASSYTVELFQEGHIDGSDHHLDYRRVAAAILRSTESRERDAWNSRHSDVRPGISWWATRASRAWPKNSKPSWPRRAASARS